MKEDFGLKPEIVENICSLADKYKAKRVVIFGSRSRGDYREKSDIDLAVWCDNFRELKEEIEDTVKTLLEFDIINMNENLSDAFRKEIEKTGKVIYEEAR